MSPFASSYSSPRTSVTLGRSSIAPPERPPFAGSSSTSASPSSSSTAHNSPFTLSPKHDMDSLSLPGPGESLLPRTSKTSFRPKSLRTRRHLTQAVGTGALFIFAGWFFLQPEQLGAVSRMGNEIASIIPGELVLPHYDQNDPWGLDMDAGALLADLSPWPSRPAINLSTPALSSQGHEADQKYNLGPTTLDAYRDQILQFVDAGFPKDVADEMRPVVEGYLVDVEAGAKIDRPWERNSAWDDIKAMWQTAKNHDKDDSNEVKTWRGDIMNGWQWTMVTDEDAASFVKGKLDGSKVQAVWDALPSGILHSDMIRYLLLALEGGIYSDTDTIVLKEPHRWGSMAHLWRDGDGWISSDQKTRILNGEDQDAVLGKPSLVVGIEADVGDRTDWAEWWPRPLQIAQWTMAAAPFHPVSLSALLRVTHATGQAISWVHDRQRQINALEERGLHEEAKIMGQASVLDEPSKGGPLGVMQWTGPSVWSDAVLGYLRAKFGLVWPDLKDLHQPLRVGDVVILPVTGFSPGVGNFNAGWPWDAQAMVEHKFAGSWKGGH